MTPHRNRRRVLPMAAQAPWLPAADGGHGPALAELRRRSRGSLRSRVGDRSRPCAAEEAFQVVDALRPRQALISLQRVGVTGHSMLRNSFDDSVTDLSPTILFLFCAIASSTALGVGPARDTLRVYPARFECAYRQCGVSTGITAAGIGEEPA